MEQPNDQRERERAIRAEIFRVSAKAQDAANAISDPIGWLRRMEKTPGRPFDRDVALQALILAVCDLADRLDEIHPPLN